MNNVTLDVLVILALGSGGNVGDTVFPLDGVVTQAISDRVAAVNIARENISRLRESESVDKVLVEKTDGLEIAGLTEEEDLFIRAWLSRKDDQQKRRPGDGMDWDESGFSAP